MCYEWFHRALKREVAQQREESKPVVQRTPETPKQEQPQPAATAAKPAPAEVETTA